jgi:hypothetical protein
LPDVRELLESAATTPRRLDLEQIRERARRRKLRPRLGAAIGTAVLLLAAGGTFALRDGPKSHLHVGGGPGTTTRPAALTSTTGASRTTVPVQPPGRFDPALSVPDGVTLCRADKLAYAPGGGLLLRFFNRSGAPCGLAGHPHLFGRAVDGNWIAIPTQLTFTAPVSAPRWTGVFDPSQTAVIEIRPITPTSSAATRCAGPELPIHHFLGLRLELPNGAGTIEITDLDFELGPCQPALSPFAYDSQDA